MYMYPIKYKYRWWPLRAKEPQYEALLLLHLNGLFFVILTAFVAVVIVVITRI